MWDAATRWPCLRRSAPAGVAVVFDCGHGIPGAGKSTIDNLVEAVLHARGTHTVLLDGDNVRHGLNKDLGFTDVDRVENIRRIGEAAKLMTDAGLIVLCSFISQFRAERDMLRERLGDGKFIEIFVDTPLDQCIA